MQYLDLFTTLLGLLYIFLEYRASIWLWAVGIVMPAMDIALYWSHGLYGDAGMAVYYTLAAVYGFAVWKFGKRSATAESEKSEKSEIPVSHMPLRVFGPVLAFFAVAWALTWYVLSTFTDSSVPVLDGFTNALSIVGLWALARKYVEQWVFWIVVDVVSCYLYVTKGVPFKALLYGLYVVIAVAGYVKWKKLAREGVKEVGEE